MAKSGFVPLLITLFGLHLGGETPRPVKLQVDGPSKSIRVGQRAMLNLRLVDADNRPVLAPKDFKVDIMARLPSNTAETLASAVLKAGAVVHVGGTPSSENGRVPLHLGPAA